MYMLDTNILIHAIRNPLSPVTDRIIALAAAGEVCVSAVTCGELVVGVLKSRNPEKNQKALEAALAGIPVLSYDSHAACCYAQIRARLEQQGIPVGDADMMIGGHAASVSCILVTNNRKHFDRMGIPVEDWLRDSLN